jgi:hypothetical protein
MSTGNNYIHRLRGEAKSLQSEVKALRQGLNDLRGYLHSHKFACGDRLDGYVHTGDVLEYLRNTESAGVEARENL